MRPRSKWSGAEGSPTPDPLTASHLQRIPAGPESSPFVAPAWGSAERSPRSIPARPDRFSGIRDQDVISRAQFREAAHAHKIDCVDPDSQAHLAPIRPPHHHPAGSRALPSLRLPGRRWLLADLASLLHAICR
jgi:hypothetical protein